MSLNLLDGLPELGGFNRLEKEEYYRLFIDSQTDTVELLTIASQVAKDNGWKLEETVQKLQSAQANQLDAIASLGKDGLNKLLQFQERQNKARLMQGFDLAKLMLQSRLSVDWLKTNQSQLADHGIKFEVEPLEAVPRRDWISNELRTDVVDQITDLLPTPLLRPVEDYAYRELHEGKVPETTDEGRESDPLAPPYESSTRPSKPKTKNSNSQTNATSESKQPELPTLASTGKKLA